METEFSIDLLEHLKNEYYNENGGKNNIFKKKQKTEIAKIKKYYLSNKKSKHHLH